MIHKGQAGFTLLELLVSITLFSLIVVVLSLAIRSGINAYIRAKDSNEYFFKRSAIEGLLSRQLECAVDRSSGSIAYFSNFRGDEKSFYFVTTYSPLGVGQGGLFLVVYAFDEKNKSLFYGQKVITKTNQLRIDVKDLLDEDTADLKKKGWKTEEIPGIEEMVFSYRPPNLVSDVPPDQWPNNFRHSGMLPGALAIKMILNGEKAQLDSLEPDIIPVGHMRL